jgi:rhodanese-related sulfurtransferase
MNTITAIELKSKIDTKEDIQLIDVREDYEFDDFNIGGINIPMDEILTSINKIDKKKPVVLCCKSGKRSKAILLALNKKHKLTNIFSLSGGVLGYQEEIGT